MANQFYMSRQRWIAMLVMALSVMSLWWAIGVRLSGAAELDNQRIRQETIEFKITNLRWQRDAMNTPEFIGIRELARQRLLADPDGLPVLVDQLQDIAAQTGMDVGVNVAERRRFEKVDGVSTRDLTLRFDGVTYDSLVAYLDALEQQSNQWVFLIRDVSLISRGGDAQVSGWVQLRIWTTQGMQPTEQDSLF